MPPWAAALISSIQDSTRSRCISTRSTVSADKAEDKTLKGKVLEISDDGVVIDLGSRQGIETGHRIEFFSQLGRRTRAMTIAVGADACAVHGDVFPGAVSWGLLLFVEGLFFRFIATKNTSYFK